MDLVESYCLGHIDPGIEFLVVFGSGQVALLEAQQAATLLMDCLAAILVIGLCKYNFGN
jgi:hypothetical protein